MSDKIIVANDTALKQKYGHSLAAIRMAIDSWIAVDATRGLKTIYVALDDAVVMAGYGAYPAVAGVENSYKVAFDAVFSAEKPLYAVLLGAPDIFPHISLKNPMYNPSSPNDDPDVVVPSDLPYACDTAYSDEPSDFVGPTRVVTRLPDIYGSNDSKFLLNAIAHAQEAKPVSRQTYIPYLGVTAAVWQQSTSLSLSAVFGSATSLKEVPPRDYRWSSSDLEVLSHFFNCHGADLDTHYYGQSGNQYPPAHDASYIRGNLTSGVILAAECCYGAQLFDPKTTGGQPGIANVYIDQGAHAVWGSTTIAYGPSDSNGQADLMCQYFFEEILAGCSVGMAALNSRQRFSKQAVTLAPSDLKTLVQYIALGDASVQPVIDTTSIAAKTTPKIASFLNMDTIRTSRYRRRTAAHDDGVIESFFRRRTAADSLKPDEVIQKNILAVASSYGVINPTITTKGVIDLIGPKLVLGTSDEVEVPNIPKRFHIVYEHLAQSERFSPRRILEIGEANGQILTVSELFRR